jgi:2,4-dienoyl-CoA reductase-like NADH-dependent reductase (Old Yellow Enzyme family)
MTSLFAPLQLGELTLPNRIFMAPLTRGRATRDAVPTAIMAEYYAQRASAGLIISEATGISREGLGWPYAPGLWTPEQVEGWKPVTEAVHQAGGRIVAQLWHMGRLVHPDLGGGTPVSSSDTTAPYKAHTYDGKKPYAQARGATPDDIARIVEDYALATRHAIAAGFDGVQLHAANGYLIDQFLRDGVNHREDEYGGPIAHRVRLLREATAALVGEAGASRVGVRLSPNGEVQGVDDSDPEALFTAAAAELQALGVAWLELREPRGESTFSPGSPDLIAPHIREVFNGALVLNSDYLGSTAQAALAAGEADAISFGRPFIANPDLVERLRDPDAPLNAPDAKTFYSLGAEGYTDYPALEEQPVA